MDNQRIQVIDKQILEIELKVLKDDCDKSLLYDLEKERKILWRFYHGY